MTKPTDPADTRMMGIVHGALQRDLLRARETAAAVPPPVGGQRRALGRHVTWLMDFLHRHHTSEDEGLWPAVRAKNPAATALLDSLEADHQRIEPAASRLRSAAERYAATDDDRTRAELVAALDDLAAVLFPHLEREVAEAMPVVSATITDGEWRAIDREHNIKSKSFAELGFEGHWLLDGIDPDGYRVVTGVVPPVPRFLLLHGFARAYRRRTAAVWQPDPAARDAVRR
ncbi:hemerythrin domain-containing protein [Nocardioides pelophilus]|uniref:hemerythrin domain-containing protein n=1 Tax=Nocardioides pelophilus TaxID=2172019 RepID=UPI001C804BDB|nr:hemerythrin domain-containing protein [Nocardioides pelophilus]